MYIYVNIYMYTHIYMYIFTYIYIYIYIFSKVGSMINLHSQLSSELSYENFLVVVAGRLHSHFFSNVCAVVIVSSQLSREPITYGTFLHLWNFLFVIFVYCGNFCLWFFCILGLLFFALLGRPGRVKFNLDGLTWGKKEPAHLSLPYDHCPVTQHPYVKLKLKRRGVLIAHKDACVNCT